jgi:urease alpha subunit
MQLEMDLGFAAIKVRTADNGGHSPDAVAEMCADKLMSVSTSAPPEIRMQAEAYKSQMLQVITHYIKVAVKEDRATMHVKIQEAGFPDLAAQLRRL